MANFLFAVFPVTGHINPGLPIARELVARGHRVRWHSTPRFKRAIEGTGARWVPYERAMQIDEERVEALFPDRPAGGIAQLRFDIERLFVEIVRGQMRDLAAELGREPADVIVGDSTAAIGKFVKEITGTKWAVYGISPIAMPSIDTAPFGLGILPSRSLLGRLRNRFLYWLVDEVIFRRANELHEEMRSDFGLPPFNAVCSTSRATPTSISTAPRRRSSIRAPTCRRTFDSSARRSRSGPEDGSRLRGGASWMGAAASSS